MITEIAELLKEPIVQKVVYSIVIILVGAVVAKVVSRVLVGLVEKGALSMGAYERVKEVVLAAVYATALLVAVSLVTGSTLVLYFLVAVFFVLMIAGIEPLSNLVSYYLILITGLVTVGSTVSIAGHTGRVRGIRLTHIELREENGRIVRVPNKQVFREATVIYGSIYPVSVTVRIHGIPDIEEETRMLMEIALQFKERVVSERPVVKIIDISEGYADFEVTISASSMERGEYLRSLFSGFLYEKMKGKRVVEIPSLMGER